MSFRKRNAVISSSGSGSPQSAQPRVESAPVPGVRPSPVDSRPTTSTGTASLDGLLAGHSGLPLGTSLLIGEHGTTDFAGMLLRYYVAEGLVQGHQVHVLGLNEGWRAELPGLSTDSKTTTSQSETPTTDKMKIAWRYETLGSVGAARDREAQRAHGASGASNAAPFCHSFDLTKKLSPANVKGQIGFHPTMTDLVLGAPPSPPFKQFIKDLAFKLANSPPAWIHRVVIPNLLSPTAYSSQACHPQHVLQFMHALRALLRQYSKSLTVIITLPLSLYPRTSGLTRWMELLCDGVLEFIPLQSTSIHNPPPSSKAGDKADEQVQGLVKVHSLPVLHEKGGGSHTAVDDQSFSLSRSKGLIIKPSHSLPTTTTSAKQRHSMIMTSDAARDGSLIRISKVAGRYLLFDIDDVMYLRRNHNICSVFAGTIPQNPQQNVFMGLPLELMPEEAQVLVEKGVGCIVDDAAFHPARLAALDAESRKAYVQSLKNQGKAMQLAAMESSKRNIPKEVKSKKNKKKERKEPEAASKGDAAVGQVTEATEDISLFDSAPVPAKTASKPSDEVEGYALTPTTSSFLLPPSSSSLGQATEHLAHVDVPASYPLFAHLHDKGYYMMPGLRFGCDYNVYPGDPLRFHSHFAAVHFGWDEEISMLDLVGGGRLATSVKKGYLFGGAVADGSSPPACPEGNRVATVVEDEGKPKQRGGPVAPPVRAFCLEWAGM
ncbi:PAXNEB protein-domain-containing protein [Xylariaceae sp. FL0594]|nr:PAXNEB protein-domain-containing protein [Xylariaceae sp. FL0594]